jgi:hypothetical protein
VLQFLTSLTLGLNPFLGHAIKGPISDSPLGTGKSSLFRHSVLRAGFPYALAESGAIE